jgi:hypothetical protein
MFQKLLTFIGLLFLSFSGLFSGDVFAASWNLQSTNNYYADPTSACSSVGYNTTDISLYQASCRDKVTNVVKTYALYSNGPVNATYSPPCPAAGTSYTGYYPAQGAATNTVYAPNGTSATCAVNIDNMKTSCPPNTVMPVFGTAPATPACIVVGVYTGTAGPSGAQSNVVPPPSTSSDCPTGTGSYSITNGTNTTTGCGVTSKSTTSNPSSTPASTTSTGSNTTNVTNTTVNQTTTTNPNGSTTTTGTEATTNNSACGGAGQPACNVNSTCGGAGQPACNTNIGDSTFTVATPTMTAPTFTDKTQGTVPTSGFAVTNYTSAGSSSCPVSDQSGSVFGQSFTLPFSQMCQYLDFVHYIVIIAAAIAAMKLI